MNTALLGIVHTVAWYNDAATRYKGRVILSAARYIIPARWYSDSPLVGILTPLHGIRDEKITPLLGIITPLHGTRRVSPAEKNCLRILSGGGWRLGSTGGRRRGRRRGFSYGCY
jgi:hypothetical protein